MRIDEMKISKKINVLDCTFRDGGYYNLWNFDDQLSKEYFKKISESKIDCIEIGFLFLKDKTKNFGKFAFVNNDFFSKFKVSHKNIAIMFNGSDLLEKNIEKKLEINLPLKKSSNLKLIRIAAHYNEIFKLKKIIKFIQKKNFKVALNLMQITELSKSKILKAVKFIKKNNLADIFYFADSLGSLNPKNTKKICNIINECWKKPFGIHAHDNCGLALNNTIMALKNGATWADATISGMGRGAGNVSTEGLVKKLNAIGFNNYKAKPLKTLSKEKFSEMKKKYGWGKSDYYKLAAKFKIHPTYIQEILSNKNLNQNEINSLIKKLHKHQKNLIKFDSNIINNEIINPKLKKLWNAKNFLKNENLLILGQGDSLKTNKNKIINYKKKYNCKIFSLNLNQYYKHDEVDYLIVTDKIRALLDFQNYTKYKNIIMPRDNFIKILPKNFLNCLNIKNFGMKINSKKILFNNKYCETPTALSLGYAIALGIIGNANQIFLAGFDGYSFKNNYQLEMENLIEDIKKLDFKNIYSITPSKYNIPKHRL
tara:strand:+ start:304 stop:1920 length:1617 start_codon:yes stop_codon:yes gene_type:complete